jgi:CheY-like chemotaxis protein
MEQKKILIVDDDEAVLLLLKEIFESAGYIVCMAKNATDALNILKTQRIMVMFLDLELPVMSGLQLCKEIRVNNQIGIIYALTGHSDIFSLLECRAAGFDDYFTKSARINVLLKAAEDAFAKLARWNPENCDL